MNRPVVSVVIPTYNCERWVRQAVDSALAQTLAPIEVIVVDDGSTDDTAGVLADVRSQVQYIHQSNQGVAAARNTGIQASAGEFIAFLDADDIWHPRKLEFQVRIMRGHPAIGTLGTRIFDWPNQPVPTIKGEVSPHSTTIDRDQLAVKNYLAASSVMVRREVVQRVGGFDTQLQGAEDHDYWLRAAELAQVAKIDLPLMGYRSLVGSLSKQARAMEADMRRILTKLDARDYWRGDRLLRRKAHSYVSYSCAFLHGAAGDQLGAIRRSVASLAWYPLPFTRDEAGVSLGRPKRLTVQVLRLAGLMQPDPGR